MAGKTQGPPGKPPLASLVEQLAANTRLSASAPWFIDRMKRTAGWSALFRDSMEAAADLVKRNIGNDQFAVYQVLGARWFSHHNSIDLLITDCHYGEAMALSRMLLEITDLMTFFSHYPEQAPAWRQAMRREPVWGDRDYRDGATQFRLTAIWDGLMRKGETPVSRQLYATLSATVHPSEWGTQFYAGRSELEAGVFALELAPSFNPSRQFWIGLMLENTLPLPVAAFLRLCETKHAPRSVWRAIWHHHQDLLPSWQRWRDINQWFHQAMEEGEKRVSSGEVVDDVWRDIEDRITAHYDPEAAPPAAVQAAPAGDTAVSPQAKPASLPDDGA